MVPLGRGADLGPVDIVLDGDLASPKKEHITLTFRFMSIVAKRLDGSRCQCTEVNLSPGHIVLDGDPAPSPERSTAAPFSAMYIVAKRSPISATAEHLFQRWL